MSEHKYILEPYKGRSTRHHCPACKQSQVFARYIDTETGQPLHHAVGRCNREDRCAYHYTPSQYFQDNPQQRADFTPKLSNRAYTPQPPKEPGRIPKHYLIRSLGYDSNFIAFLCSIFDRYTLESATIEQLMRDYYLGCTKDKSVIFWQVDINNRIRTGKIMQYLKETGKRVKNASGAIDWVHSKLKRDKVLPEDFNLQQCLFGEHLLNRYPDKTVCLVESEKSAIIGSGAMPNYVWLATGGKQNLKAGMCRALKGRDVILIPDLGAYDEWRAKGESLAREIGFKIEVSDMLEQVATDADKAAGLDIADYLIRQLKASIPEPTPKIPVKVPTHPLTGEERALQHLGSLNPNIYTLIDTLGLVSAKTGNKLRTTIN